MSIHLEKFSEQIKILEKANRTQEDAEALRRPGFALHQPVHVVYGGAHLFSEATLQKLSALANQYFHQFLPDHKSLINLLKDSLTESYSEEVFARLGEKMRREPLEDYRIDFEDGYGIRGDEEEDRHAVVVGSTLKKLHQAGSLPKLCGVRVKPLNMWSMRRSLKTLALVIEALGQGWDKNGHLKKLIITLPKVTNEAQVKTLVRILEEYESIFQFGPGFFEIELIVEAPEAILTDEGQIVLPTLLKAAKNRCRGLHFGIYDFTSSLGVGSAGQAIDHNVCDFARQWIQLAAAMAPGLTISDGIINQLPISGKNSNQNPSELHRIWKYNFDQMTSSLKKGFYQGWDIHPSQIHIRHLANIVYVLKEYPSARDRLKSFLDRQATASHVQGVFDDRASVLGLVSFFDRALSSQAISKERLDQDGLDLDLVKKLISFNKL